MNADESHSPPHYRSEWGAGLLTGLLAISLTYAFWPTLWQGGGLVGGDIYSYFFPQKQVLADAFQTGRIPFWNHRTGHGYPVLGESQTGVFYPFHFLYGLLNLNAAYNTVQLTHYAIAFFSCWLMLRRLGITTLAAWMGGVSYVYGWLPTRMVNEWAAIGAAWLPLALWAAESFLQSARWRYVITLSGLLGLQMLAGHFHLAFITQLALLLFLSFRLTVGPAGLSPAIAQHKLRTAVILAVFMACGFGLASIQLLPTWELKQLSQRAQLGAEHDPGFGFIPWSYLGQMIAPWAYYQSGVRLEAAPDGAVTNSVEAHLYCGLLPLLLCVIELLRYRRNQRSESLFFLVLGLFALIYSTGLLMPVTRHLPGFGFFNGVGRIGILVNLSVAVLSSSALARILSRTTSRKALSLGLLCLLLTVADTFWISKLTAQVFAVERPPIQYLSDSPFRKELSQFPQPVRLFCRGANLPNLLGVASTPVYLGLGPSAYFDPDWAMPQPLLFDSPPTAEQITWLREAGVTHVLSFSPLDQHWPVKLVLMGPDPFLNRAWARGAAPLYLYELDQARGRVAWTQPVPDDMVSIKDYQPERIEIEATSATGGTVVLTDLYWPGWTVEVDDAPSQRVAGLGLDREFRCVEVSAGAHRIVWKYQPPTLAVGTAITFTTLLFLATIAHVCFWHPKWVERLTGLTPQS